MRTITKTHTGNIISDEDLMLEYLYVGDYGKENNIKADFLGYTKRIDKVENTEVNLSDKLVVTVSSQKGCPMHCNFCDCPKYGFHGNAPAQWDCSAPRPGKYSFRTGGPGRRRRGPGSCRGSCPPGLSGAWR